MRNIVYNNKYQEELQCRRKLEKYLVKTVLKK